MNRIPREFLIALIIVVIGAGVVGFAVVNRIPVKDGFALQATTLTIYAWPYEALPIWGNPARTAHTNKYLNDGDIVEYLDCDACESWSVHIRTKDGVEGWIHRNNVVGLQAQ